MSTQPPSTIIVLCTGRCGSTTLSAACQHLTSHSCAHESRTHLIGPARFDFGSNHIEIDNRLAWFLGRLDSTWGDNAAYVHLTRNPENVAQSFTTRIHQGIIKGYREAILSRSLHLSRDTPILDICRDYIETVTSNITHFLRDKTHVMDMTLETMPDDFEQFIGWIDAQGDLDAARAELSIAHNASKAKHSS